MRRQNSKFSWKTERFARHFRGMIKSDATRRLKKRAIRENKKHEDRSWRINGALTSHGMENVPRSSLQIHLADSITRGYSRVCTRVIFLQFPGWMLGKYAKSIKFSCGPCRIQESHSTTYISRWRMQHAVVIVYYLGQSGTRFRLASISLLPMRIVEKFKFYSPTFGETVSLSLSLSLMLVLVLSLSYRIKGKEIRAESLEALHVA